MNKLASVFMLAFLLSGPTQAKNRPDEVMVRFRAGTPPAEAQKALESAGVREADEVPALRLKLVKLPPGLTVERAMERLGKHPRIESVEPNMELHASTLPNDTLFPLQWGLDRISASRAWGSSLAGAEGSGSVVIAIVDSGIDLDQPDFAGKLVAGTNILNPAVSADDDNGHGTMVAGIAGAASDNGAGITGVARNSPLMPVKVLDAAGNGDEFGVIKGLNWAVEHGARVVNISIGSCDEDGNCGTGSSAGADAVEAAWQAGAIVVAASGNEGTGNPSYPSAYPFVVAVGATKRDDTIAPYSNWGGHLDLCAPGGDGTSACDATESIISLSRLGLGCGGPWGDAEAADGTSLASPFVSGVAAVLMGGQGLTNAEAHLRMISTSDRPDSARWDPHHGYGRVNLYRALTNDRNQVVPGEKVDGYAYPNPFSPPRDRHANFIITGGTAGQGLEIRIRDVRGTLVWEKSLSDGEVAAADLYYNTPLKWDGRDSKGRMAPNGIYFAVVKAGGTRKVIKLAVLH